MTPKEQEEMVEENQVLKRTVKELKGQARFLADMVMSAGSVRSHTEPCPRLEVNRYVLGHRLFGRVTWVGNGGGVWQGQELCRVDGHKDVIPTNQLEVL